MDQSPLLRFFLSAGFISPQRANDIVSHFRPRLLEKGEYFLRAGNTDHEYLFLQNGFMRSFAIDPEGNEVTTGFFAPGQIVMEVSSFFNRTAAMESIIATERSEGWYLHFDTLNHLFHSIQEFREFGRGILVKNYALLKTRMLSLITETAEQRYARLLHTNPEIFQQASLKHIASYLGVTDTSLSRIRKELAKKEGS